MLTGKILENFAKLTLKIGVNLQRGQGLELACPVEKKEVAEVFTSVAYSLGAKIVRIRWEDEIIDRLNYEKADITALTSIPKWYVESKNDLVKNGFCYVAISAEDPSAFNGVDDKVLFAVNKAKGKALVKFSEEVMSNGIRWCVVSVPTIKWAKQVFPNSENPEEELSIAMEKTMRLDFDDPVKAWEDHIEKLCKRAEFLNKQNFEYLLLKSKNGTDLKVGLCVNHVWLSAKEKAKDGIEFVANMPTEEVFTAPHSHRVDGTVYSAMPLCFNGQIIDNFSVTFKNGKVVNFTAEKGYEALKNIINTDKGCARLGEIALIGKNSPIAQSKILFYNTLFDENASCHLAFGKGYPTTVKNGDNLDKKTLKELGLNDSIEHVDFMIGSPDLEVIGLKSSGEKIPLFYDGEWII